MNLHVAIILFQQPCYIYIPLPFSPNISPQIILKQIKNTSLYAFQYVFLKDKKAFLF